MSDPVLALVLSITFLALLTAASYFRTLDLGLWRDARNPVIAGVVAAAAIALFDRTGWAEAILIGVLFTAAALYVRLTGRESEPADGLALGAVTGTAAAIPLIALGEGGLATFAQCILAGSVAGFGITFGLTHVRDRLRQAGVDAATGAAAIGLAWAVEPLSGLANVTARHVAVATAVGVPLALVATVFGQWPQVVRELREEARLGVLDEEEVRRTSHPLLRLTRGGWQDREARREFVRIARLLALRKRQQRGRAGDVARIYQVEVIKLRMQLQEMSRIDHSLRAAAGGQEQAAR